MQQTGSEQYGVGNQFTSCCEFHRLAEDDEMHNVNDEQVEEEQVEREQNELMLLMQQVTTSGVRNVCRGCGCGC